MTENTQDNPVAPTSSAKSMDDIVALCRRRGFIWQSSELYGGINGFWDYGPMGAQLKKNLKDAWWKDIVTAPADGPDGQPLDMRGLDCTIIMHPKVWIASGHAAGFNDPMVDDKQTKQRFRADHLCGLYLIPDELLSDVVALERKSLMAASFFPIATAIAAGVDEAIDVFSWDKQVRKLLSEAEITPHPLNPNLYIGSMTNKNGTTMQVIVAKVSLADLTDYPDKIVSPFSGEAGSLTPPRQFNLMFESHAGPIKDEDNKVWLRPETAQGIFTQFWNVVDTSRVKVPFGIAQIGKAFRNEVTPRNFTFRSREFEQMEIEFFIVHPEALKPGDLSPVEWYQYWRKSRFEWWQKIGLAGDNLQLREHDRDELSHYAKEGAGVCDVEYRFPFTAPGFGELEGIAHRADFDLKAHANACGKGDKLKYFDQARSERYFPHVIEPSAGADRGTLALICEAYTPDPSRPSGVYMKFNPRMAPIKAGIFPLVNKDGMPEVADKLYKELRKSHVVEFDEKQSIGKRYARMDEAGTPYCFTIDGETLTNQTVTVRERDSASQQRISLDQVPAFLADKL
jgi:glycyl-tRNA synthetase